MANEVWANCENCREFSLMHDRQYCKEFDILGLPKLYSVDTNRKCCSLFNSEDAKIKTPNLEEMEEGALYFYSSNNPEILFEDIDL